jgi:endonuclease III
VTRISFAQVVERLQVHYGQPRVRKLDGPSDTILWENVAYLADDDRRRKAFQTLKKRVGTEPAQLLSASEGALLEVTRHGILADQFAKKLRRFAKIALEEFDSDLRPVLKLPIAKPRKPCSFLQR